MAYRDTIRRNAAPLLAPGEEIQAVIPAQTLSGYWALLSGWILLLSGGLRVIVATDRRILVCRSGRMRRTVVGEVLSEHPRATRIGPAHGLWYRTEALGQRLYIGRNNHRDVSEADAALDAAPAPAA